MAEDQDAPVVDDAGNADDKTPEPKAAAAPAEPNGDVTPEPSKGGWPDDWRDRLAEHRSAGNDGEFKKEMRRLEKIADPSLIYGSYRDLENTWHSKGFVKVPGENATDQDIDDYRKALGVPEKMESYFENATLIDDIELDDDDIPGLTNVAKSLHTAGATQEVMDAFFNTYIELKGTQASEQEDNDFKSRSNAKRELKEEFGNAYDRKAGSVAAIFASAPGGADANNPDALFSRLLGGRMSDGSLIGDSPDFIRWAATVAQEINPAQSVVEDAENGGVSIEAELKEISRARRDSRADYNKDTAMQARERELLDAQDRIRARA